MRILVAHNSYMQRGGEDAVVEAEVALLRHHGHQVTLLERDNHEIGNIGTGRLALDTLWSNDTVRRCRIAITDFRPDVIHIHNTFPLISPSIYWAAAGVPVVQTLHNFRLLCPQAMLLRDGRVCEDCVGHLPWRAAVHGCYRGSRAQSALLGGMLATHRALGTWSGKIARYIALNEFCRAKFIAGGLPAERIAVKPNFADVPTAPAGPDGERRGGLFVGRLSPEKGVALLLDAMDLVPGADIRIAGDGPLRGLVAARQEPRRLGALAAGAVLDHMGRAAYLVMPSLWYENAPRTLIEAFACGLPVIASRLGALAELIDDGRTGLLFEPGNAADLADRIRWTESNPAELRRMGAAARAEYEARYTPQANYLRLAEIYREATTATARGCSAP